MSRPGDMTWVGAKAAPTVPLRAKGRHTSQTRRTERLAIPEDSIGLQQRPSQRVRVGSTGPSPYAKAASLHHGKKKRINTSRRRLRFPLASIFIFSFEPFDAGQCRRQQTSGSSLQPRMSWADITYKFTRIRTIDGPVLIFRSGVRERTSGRFNSEGYHGGAILSTD